MNILLRKNKLPLSLLVLWSLGIGPAFAQRQLPQVTVTAQVMDELAVPIAGASVKFIFGDAHNANAIIKLGGVTDSAGRFTGTGYSDGTFGASVTKEGYYVSGVSAPPLIDIVNGKAQSVIGTSVLRPIGKPVALHAKRVQTEIPILNDPCGYDLEKGDWVSPHGRGEHSDLTFTARRDYKDWFNFTVEAEVTFAQPLDGFTRMKAPAYARNSIFRWERSAPETGYTAPHAIRFIMRDPKLNQFPERTFEINKDREQGYFFRVRTVEENGRIVAGNYGKITGDIEIEARNSKTCLVIFTYYYNPTSLDRNLEWDPKRNLLQGLSREETPTDP